MELQSGTHATPSTSVSSTHRARRVMISKWRPRTYTLNMVFSCMHWIIFPLSCFHQRLLSLSNRYESLSDSYWCHMLTHTENNVFKSLPMEQLVWIIIRLIPMSHAHAYKMGCLLNPIDGAISVSPASTYTGSTRSHIQQEGVFQTLQTDQST